MLKTRNRIINFRVTESEFEQLMTASMENGASCMSDYVRNRDDARPGGRLLQRPWQWKWQG